MHVDTIEFGDHPEVLCIDIYLPYNTEQGYTMPLRCYKSGVREWCVRDAKEEEVAYASFKTEDPDPDSVQLVLTLLNARFG